MAASDALVPVTYRLDCLYGNRLRYRQGSRHASGVRVNRLAIAAEKDDRVADLIDPRYILCTKHQSRKGSTDLRCRSLAQPFLWHSIKPYYEVISLAFAKRGKVFYRVLSCKNEVRSFSELAFS